MYYKGHTSIKIWSKLNSYITKVNVYLNITTVSSFLVIKTFKKWKYSNIVLNFQLTSALFLALGEAWWRNRYLNMMSSLSDMLMLLNYVLDPILYVLMRQRRRMSASALCHSISHCFKRVRINLPNKYSILFHLRYRKMKCCSLAYHLGIVGNACFLSL